jgi:energy-coupling factor transport system substrate-specific component
MPRRCDTFAEEEFPAMNKSTFQMIFASLCVVMNLVFGTLVQSLQIPLLFLDTIGTIFGAVLFGPFYGVLIGLVTNVVQGILTNPRDIPFALVNMAIGLLWGGRPQDPFPLSRLLRCRAVPCRPRTPIGTPIAVWIYGGLTGGGTDFLFLWLYQSGHKIFTAAFLPRITGNLVDKIASAVLVALLVAKMPPRFLAMGNNPHLFGGADKKVS